MTPTIGLMHAATRMRLPLKLNKYDAPTTDGMRLNQRLRMFEDFQSAHRSVYSAKGMTSYTKLTSLS